jgi:hypothetical protein
MPGSILCYRDFAIFSPEAPECKVLPGEGPSAPSRSQRPAPRRRCSNVPAKTALKIAVRAAVVPGRLDTKIPVSSLFPILPLPSHSNPKPASGLGILAFDPLKEVRVGQLFPCIFPADQGERFAPDCSLRQLPTVAAVSPAAASPLKLLESKGFLGRAVDLRCSVASSFVSLLARFLCGC